MSMLNIPLFQAMNAKMTYLGHQQKVLAENIANADMPGYRAKELSPMDFAAVLKQTAGGQQGAANQMAATKPGHVGAATSSQQVKVIEAKSIYEVAPNENSVVIEEQMVKANEAAMEYNLITNLMRKQIGMVYTALGRNG